MDGSKAIIVQLVHKALDPSFQFNLEDFKNVNWDDIRQTANAQGVLGIAFDALEYLPVELRPEKKTLVKWYGQMSYMEHRYEEQIGFTRKLANCFSKNQIPAVLMKGYGLSLNYPKPNRRPTGDVDLYHCGVGDKADEIIKDLGVKVKQNEEKHSTYHVNGVLVENHATIICELEHKALGRVERFMEDELKTNSVLDTNIGCLLPSDMFNAVYLPLHLGFHFVYNEANFKQVVDWALFLKNHHSIDWGKVRDLAEDAGYFHFLCCLNGIVIDYLGIDAADLPEWPRNKQLENRVLAEIVSGKDTKASNTYMGKFKRYLDNRWKYQLVFGRESHSQGFFLHLRSWLIWKWGIGGKNIWERTV